MLLDRDTRRSPRTRVLAVITRRSSHCSLLRTHKPGSPLLLCLTRTPMPLAPNLNPLFDCSKRPVRPCQVPARSGQPLSGRSGFSPAFGTEFLGSGPMWMCGDIFAAARRWRGRWLTTGRLSCRHPVVVCAGRGRGVAVAGRAVAWACSGRGAAICVRVSSSVNHL